MKSTASRYWWFFFLVFTGLNNTNIHSMALKYILVTGGNKGIGKAICQRLLREWDDTHVILASRDASRGQDAIDDICRNFAADEHIGSVRTNTNIKERLELLVMDTSSTESVQHAASSLPPGTKLYGIINNAGIGFGLAMKDVINTNYFGPRRVNEFFGPYLSETNGRIVNIASASGPNYVSSLPQSHPDKTLLGQPWTIANGIAQLDQMAMDMIQNQPSSEGYGVSKALLNAYTWILAKQYDVWSKVVDGSKVIVNSVTPGYIATDLTAGFGATKLPSDGAIPPCFLLMDETIIPNVPTGRYYGSDCIRSPIAFYRGPGEAPYESNDDLVELLPNAKATPPSMALLVVA